MPSPSESPLQQKTVGVAAAAEESPRRAALPHELRNGDAAWLFGPAARAAGRHVRPALNFPEMLHPQHVEEDWSPTFVDYFHFAFATATAFSPTDVSAVKPWMKLMMMAEEAISLVVPTLVVARAVNILK